MKKIILLISIILIFGCVTCYASEATTISLHENVIEDKISISINISENSEASGGKLDIVYDNNLLSATSYEVGKILSGYNCFVNLTFKDNTIRLSWAGIEELMHPGTLCTIEFTCKSSTTFSTDIGIDYSKLANADGNPISVEVSNCTVSYSGSAGHSSGHTSSGINTNENSENKENKTNDESVNSDNAEIAFSDVKENDWFYANVQYVVENNLMNGVAEDKFAPNDTLTRAMLVTVLYRNAGEPAVNKSIPFADVDMGSWYANAVVWAKQNGIVNGVNDTEFAPDANITREQIAAIMFRYAQYKGIDAVTLEENLHFADANEISEYAVSAMNWAVGTGLMKGKSTTTINPKDNATRAEIAAILQRFIEANK